MSLTYNGLILSDKNGNSYAITEATMKKKAKLLILEDEYWLGKNLKIFFEAHGFEVFFTTHGEHALDLLKENHPNIFALDLLMPGMDGYRVLEETQKFREKLRVIIITGTDISGKKDFLLSHGADLIIEKPFDPDRLLQSMRGLMAANGFREETN